MSLRTPICDLFDIEHPVFLAGMGGVAYAEVCAAVSEAGGFGTLGMAGSSPEAIRDEMRAVRRLTNRPFGVDLLAAQVDVAEMNTFKDLAVSLKQNLKSAVVVLGAVLQDKPSLVVAVSDDLKDTVPAGDFIKEVAREINGGGGGSPILATAGGKDVNLLTNALTGVPALLEHRLNSSDKSGYLRLNICLQYSGFFRLRIILGVNFSSASSRLRL